MKLSSNQRKYLLLGQCLIPFVINFVLNGLIGLVMFRGVNPVPTWGAKSSAGPDLIVTGFKIPLLLTSRYDSLLPGEAVTTGPSSGIMSLPRGVRTCPF
ncbi:MAG: hypothetical protein PVF14_16475 [Desulfobacterales bacterium]